MVSFIIRAVIAGSDSAGHNLGLVITDQSLFNIGYFGLLYSAHALVLDRELVSQVPLPNNIVSRIVRFRTWYKAVLLEGVFLSFGGLWKITRFNPNDMPLVGNSTVISLVLVVLVAFHTVVLARTEFHRGAYHHGKESLGAKYGTYILVVISMLLIIREVFATATMWNLAKHNKEHFWYPLIALPEILAVILYMTPDLVPLRSEVPESGSGVL